MTQMRGIQKINEHTLFLQIHGRIYWQLLSGSLGSTPQSLSLPGQGDSHTTKNQQKRQSRIFYFDAFAVFLVFSSLAGTLTCLNVATTALCGHTLAQKEGIVNKKWVPWHLHRSSLGLYPYVQACILMFRPDSHVCAGLFMSCVSRCFADLNSEPTMAGYVVIYARDRVMSCLLLMLF